MPLNVTSADWRALFPRAPQSVIDAFASPQGMAALQKAGILETKTRLAYALANVEHECGGFTIKDLTENINYTASRMAQVWPNRFSSAAAVQAKYGTGPGWQLRAFDDIYGNRMGNRPGTRDGSTYIGRAGPQVTGRDGYTQVGKRCGLPLAANPQLATLPANQPAILAAFIEWKGMNRYADLGDFRGGVKSWNGGTNGMADRQHHLAGNNPIIQRLGAVNALSPAINKLPGKPASPDKAIKDATKNEKGALAGGAATGATGAGTTAAKPPPKPSEPDMGLAWAGPLLIAIGLAVAVYAIIRISEKARKIKLVWQSPVVVVPSVEEVK